MRVKTAVMLCEASFVAGALLGKPAAMKARCQGEKAVRKTARGYVRLRGKARDLGDKTGKPGLFAALAVVFAAQTAKDAATKWWQVVDEVEQDLSAEKVVAFETPEPPSTIEEYLGSPS